VVIIERPAIGDHGFDPGLLATLIELGAAGLAVTELDASTPRPQDAPGAVRIGVHRAGRLPSGGLEVFDVLISADPAAPAPWVGVAPERLDAVLASLRVGVQSQPVAAAVAAQVLRMTLLLPFEQALALESLAYSMLLASAGFAAWRAATPVRPRPTRPDRPRVLVDHDAAGLRIRLNRPEARNAFDARMRDELVEALDFALVDPDASAVALSGRGPAFSAGGDLDEFGQARDVGRAHLIRGFRSPAGLVHRLGGRITARLHGHCIGAGIEVPAAAARVLARPGALFRLPEVSMGLIPGAGGTASLPRRVGRQRACYMALSGATIDLDTALAWGLVDAVEPIA
jgi:hypothetical protein